GWDVVNEAIEGDGSYRKSKFYEILGEEYIPLPRLSHAGSKPTPDERGPGRPKPSRRMGG
ncbi:endo-1,4-beta-xylanase, partial [Bilophila wadsworthia]|uniref:endo-1,4-beta-xylanase n=1 Tax=Bilophila wadsworthia TaxID=35833 RepID=UPI003AB2931D